MELERENSKARNTQKVVTTVSQTYYPSSGCKSYGMGIEYGNLEVAVQNSYSVQGNISSGTLVNIGFSASYTVGITTYYRRYVPYSKTFLGGW